MRLYLEPHKIGDDRCLGGWKLVEYVVYVCAFTYGYSVCTHLAQWHCLNPTRKIVSKGVNELLIAVWEEGGG